MQSLDSEAGERSSRGTAAPGRIPISHYFIFAVTKCEFKINVLLYLFYHIYEIYDL
jgi:hypothetical protein